MLGIPKTPKGARYQRQNEQSVFRRAITPMPKSQFLLAATSLTKQIRMDEYISQIPSPPGTRREFIPKLGNTSTPACAGGGLNRGEFSIKAPHDKSKNRLMQSTPIKIVQLESDEELSFPLPPVIMASPEPRPSSEPLFDRNMSPTSLPPRPSTAEPVEAPKLPTRSPRKRFVAKCTFAKTPHCARPTKSWLNRIACYKRED
ncbi:unnamed protein product [Caenorhabditis brenneri]